MREVVAAARTESWPALSRLLRDCCVLLTLASAGHAQTLTFTTLAGPQGGPGSIDGAGSLARFTGPSGVAVDNGGNTYVADLPSNTIRKITSDGTVTTFAGSAGLAGSADGLGSAARFNEPTGVAVDASGHVYVADAGNHTIRKITTGGRVSTLAGSPGHPGSGDGAGAAARFYFPQSVATDSGGNVYVGDSGNYTIRKITPAGVVTTLAGSAGLKGSLDGTGSSARFNTITGIAADAAGVLYVIDTQYLIVFSSDPCATYGGTAIRKITASGVVTTVLSVAFGYADGTGSEARFDDPQDIAVDPSGVLYVADTFNHTVRRITPEAVVTTLAGAAHSSGSTDGNGSAARFNRPSGIAVANDGSVLVADGPNYAIRRITTAGVVSTLAGSAVAKGLVNGTAAIARFDSPHGIAVDADGTLYIADTGSGDCSSGDGNGSIRKLTAGGVVSTFVSRLSAGFYLPFGVAVDAGGSVYVADTYNHTIRKITAGGTVTTLAGTAGLSGSADGTGSAARFSYPHGVALDASGNAYVADTRNDMIRKITPAGVVTTLAGTATAFGSADGTGSAATFRSPKGIAVDGSGNVYVADTFNSTIRKITPAGVVTTVAGSAGLAGRTDGIGSAARFRYPVGVAIDGGGNAYVADTENHTIRMVTPAGVVTTIGGSGGVFGSAAGTGNAARFHFPYGVAIDSSGNVYVADRGNARIVVGRPALADSATIDRVTGVVGSARQLETNPQTASSWQWTIVRQPSASIAQLSSASIRNPLFTPDVADRFEFQLTASDAVRTSITTVGLTSTPPFQNGDANADGTVNAADVFHLINHLFAAGPEPVGPADVNGDGQMTASDVFYLINYLFAGGPQPL